MVFKTPSFIRTEVERTTLAIRAIGYGGPVLFRPPYGKKLLGLPHFLRSQGIPTIMWDIEPDSQEELAGSADRMVEHVLGRVRPGSIILLHAMNHRPSLDAVEPLLVRLAQQGYRFVTVSELLSLESRDGK
jgi:peptidoglycan/xylan/chitin deacetylase (PgdA/CDA1 family)